MKYTFLALMCALLLLPLGISAQQRGPLQTAESGVELLGPELDPTQNYTALMETNQGTITIELFADKAPLTVRNFVNLAEGTKPWKNPKTNVTEKKPYYDGIIFHRVIKGFMIQGGDIEGTGRGGPGFRFGDEVNNGLSFAKTPYALAMANAGPGTNGSQFFITDKGSFPAYLDNKHTIFGKVIEGQDVVDKIASAPKAPGDRPTANQTINKVTIKRTPKAEVPASNLTETPAGATSAVEGAAESIPASIPATGLTSGLKEKKAEAESKVEENKAKAEEKKAEAQSKAAEAKAQGQEKAAEAKLKSEENKAKAEEKKAEAQSKAADAKAKGQEKAAEAKVKGEEQKEKSKEKKLEGEKKVKEAKSKAESKPASQPAN